MSLTPSTTSSPSKKELSQDIGASLATLSLPTTVKKAAPRVLFHLIRHGQATHNNPSLPIATATAIAITDPPLTHVGTTQCKMLGENFLRAPYRSKTDLILCSPLLRTRLTAYIAFSQITKNPLRIILYPALKELGPGPCNTGLSLRDLKIELDPEIWDYSLVHEGWENEFCATVGEAATHCRGVRQELWELGKLLVEGGEWKGLVFERWEEERDVEVLVVSHGKNLSDLLGFQYQQFHNGEWKTVAFPTEEMMKVEGWWREFQETSLLQVEVQLSRVTLFRGGKPGPVPSRSSPKVREVASEAVRQEKETVPETGKEMAEVDEKEAVEKDEDGETGGVLF